MFGSSIVIERQSIGEAWEALVQECWTDGRVIATEYGEDSRDLSPGIAYIIDPLSEPRIHRAVFAWHKKDSYAKEILKGTEDRRIGKDWHYTYHQRLFEWPYANSQVADVMHGQTNPCFSMGGSSCLADFIMSGYGGVNQIAYIIDKLKKVPYSRRAQAVTWQPLIDEWVDGPPCLQRVWCRVASELGSPSKSWLEMHTYWRSRDLWKAWWLNVWGMVALQQYIAKKLNVGVGRYVDISSSLHIYERDWESVEKNFIEIVKTRSYEERFVWPKKKGAKK